MPMTTNHFLGWGISVIFDLTFLPGGRAFYINFLENVKSLPYAYGALNEDESVYSTGV